MSGECEKCGEHCLDCICDFEDDLIEYIKKYGNRAIPNTTVKIIYNILTSDWYKHKVDKKHIGTLVKSNWDEILDFYENCIVREANPKSES